MVLLFNCVAICAYTRRCRVFIVNFEHINVLPFVVFLLLTLIRKIFVELQVNIQLFDLWFWHF